MNTLAARGLKDLLPKRRRAAVVHMLHAHRAEKLLFGQAGGCEHLRTSGVGQLDRGKADSPGPGVDEHPLAALEPCKLESKFGSNEADGYGGEGGRGEPGGNGNRHDRLGDQLR